MNDAKNGVFLPCKKGDTNPPPGYYHPSLHSDDYLTAVFDRLEPATTRDDVIAALSQIRQELLNKTFPK